MFLSSQEGEPVHTSTPHVLQVHLGLRGTHLGLHGTDLFRLELSRKKTQKYVKTDSNV